MKSKLYDKNFMSSNKVLRSFLTLISVSATLLVNKLMDLLVLNPFEGTEILEPAEFEKRIIKGSTYR